MADRRACDQPLARLACAPAGASTLGKDDVEKMVSEAEKFAGEDKKKREAVDTKNQVRVVLCAPTVTGRAGCGAWGEGVGVGAGAGGGTCPARTRSCMHARTCLHPAQVSVSLRPRCACPT